VAHGHAQPVAVVTEPAPEKSAAAIEWTYRYEERVGILLNDGMPVDQAEAWAKKVMRNWLESERTKPVAPR